MCMSQLHMATLVALTGYCLTVVGVRWLMPDLHMATLMIAVAIGVVGIISWKTSRIVVPTAPARDNAYSPPERREKEGGSLPRMELVRPLRIWAEDPFAMANTTQNPLEDGENHSLRTESDDTETIHNSPMAQAAFLPCLPNDLVATGIWPKLVGGTAMNFPQKTRTIATVRGVCTYWRDWVTGTAEYADYREAWVDHLLDEDRGRHLDEYRSDDFESDDVPAYAWH